MKNGSNVTVGTFLIGLIIFAVILAAVSAAVMLLGNVVLGHYDIKPLDYSSALALTVLSALLFGGSRLSNGKD